MKALRINRKALGIGLVLLCVTILSVSVNHTSASSSAAAINTPQNEQLDFTIANKTGYGIKLLYIGPSNTPDWTDDMEILKGRTFHTGTEMPIRFSPKTRAKKWDIMVKWTDGSKGAEWLGLDLSTVEKLTILYDAETDKTSFHIN